MQAHRPEHGACVCCRSSLRQVGVLLSSLLILRPAIERTIAIHGADAQVCALSPPHLRAPVKGFVPADRLQGLGQALPSLSNAGLVASQLSGLQA